MKAPNHEKYETEVVFNDINPFATGFFEATDFLSLSSSIFLPDSATLSRYTNTLKSQALT